MLSSTLYKCQSHDTVIQGGRGGGYSSPCGGAVETSTTRRMRSGHSPGVRGWGASNLFWQLGFLGWLTGAVWARLGPRGEICWHRLGNR